MTRVTALIGSLSLAGLVASAAVRQQTPVQSAPTGLVHGRVVEGVTDTAVADALVSLSGRNAPYLNFSALTDANGNFVFFDVPAGSYGLSSSAVGYWMGEFGQRRFDGRGRTLMLAAGQRIAEATLPIWKLVAISGSVTDDLGEPVVGVKVQAMGRYSNVGSLFSNVSPNAVRTDDRGQYRLHGLVPGAYVVTVPPSELALITPDSPARVGSTGDRAYPLAFYPGVDTITDASIITLAPGDERRGVDFPLRFVRTQRVSGRLTGSGGAPAGGINVDLTRVDPQFLEDPIVARATTSVDGAFVLARVPPGAYVIRVFDLSGALGGRGGGAFAAGGSRDERPLIATTPLTDPDTHWASTPITVGDADVTDVAVPLRRGLRLDGRVVVNGTPPSQAAARSFSVSVVAAGGRRVIGTATRSAEMEANGHFRSIGLPPGRYFVQNGYGGFPGWAIESIMLDGRSVLDDPIVLDDRDVSDLVIALTDRPSEVTGTVRAPGGAADLDATVLILPAARSAWLNIGLDAPRFRSVRTALDGSFSAKGLPGGDYLAAAVKDDIAAFWQMPAFLERLSGSATKVTIATSEKKTVDLVTIQVQR